MQSVSLIQQYNGSNSRSQINVRGMSNQGIPPSVNILHSMGVAGQFLDVRYYFHNLVLTTPPELLSEQADGNKRHLSLKMPFVFDEQAQVAAPIGQIQRSDAMVQVNQVEMDFDYTADNVVTRYNSTMTFNQQGLIKEK